MGKHKQNEEKQNEEDDDRSFAQKVLDRAKEIDPTVTKRVNHFFHATGANTSQSVEKLARSLVEMTR